jgi:hypothetical protein
MEKDIRIDIRSLIMEIKASTRATQGLSEAQIRQRLTEIPDQKVQASEIVYRTKAELQDAEFDLKRVMAKYQVLASTQKEDLNLSSADDRKAFVLGQPDVVAAEKRLVLARLDHTAAEVVWVYFDDSFTAIRKQATLIEKQMDTVQQYAKYQRPDHQEDII